MFTFAQSVTSVGATNSNQINPISIPKDATCAEQIESKQTTRTTPDKFTPTYPNSDEFLQPSSSVVIQSPTRHRLYEPTTSGVEHKKNDIAPSDQQLRNRQWDGSQNEDLKIDAESGNGTHNTEEKSKEEVVTLSPEKTSIFSKTAKISTVSDAVSVAGDTLNRYGNFIVVYALIFAF